MTLKKTGIALLRQVRPPRKPATGMNKNPIRDTLSGVLFQAIVHRSSLAPLVAVHTELF